MTSERLSNCCGARPIGEMDVNYVGRCSRCREGAIFLTEEENESEIRTICEELSQGEVESRCEVKTTGGGADTRARNKCTRTSMKFKREPAG
jgi:hypothetical protein